VHVVLHNKEKVPDGQKAVSRKLVEQDRNGEEDYAPKATIQFGIGDAVHYLKEDFRTKHSPAEMAE
jgi:hypothetical protein